eukprot:CAMPEP_0172452120 /NCGR_PEP_ID=MMETSP1065-20121228/9876_1 /TAXON_ID=265537 /ORGANISM="Amphiprora paludosa, Strain CCMP125" /LENGTH=48 /DNA_ID= /DNA_START= /DNA_END= /DNA_ORIENTATION=
MQHAGFFECPKQLSHGTQLPTASGDFRVSNARSNSEGSSSGDSFFLLL